MKQFTPLRISFLLSLFAFPFFSAYAQTETVPQVDFSQRTSAATPSKTTYAIKGDFTMLGNTNLTLVNYGLNTNNEGAAMKYVDIDGDANTLNSSMATLEISNSGENTADQNCSTVLFAGLYWTGKSNDSNESFSVTKNTVTKNYNKKAISLKGPGASDYTIISAKPSGVNSEIRFPGNAQSGIFIGYQEVTDYVKTHGPGAYTVADIALVEGTNNNPGLSGGWVMIVIYENSLMKSRAVTLFDGYAFVNGQKPAVLFPFGNGIQGEFGNINISGFTTVATGQVNMKLGVMAAEGDVVSPLLNNDYLAVQKLNLDPLIYPTNYLTLNHAGNTATNFFNSSIFPSPVVGKSNPILQNNTGIDFSMFTIPNTGNLIISNNQTATTFRFGSTFEVYTIFGFAMSVDTYIPKPKGIINVKSIAGIVPSLPLSAVPGNEIEYKIDIKNTGSETTTNTIITIPIPTSVLYIANSIATSNINSLFTPANVPIFDSLTNAITWNVGAIPLLINPNDILGSLSFRVVLTNDCATLFNSGCGSTITLNGSMVGVGLISGENFNNPISQGLDPNSSCGGLIEQPILVNFDSSNSPCFAALAGDNRSPTLCGLEAVTLDATAGTLGLWSIVSGPSGGGEVFADASSSSSEFSSPHAGIYTLRWTIPFGGSNCTPITDDVEITITPCTQLGFDGIDDNVNFNNNFNLNIASFSLEIWMKLGTTNGDIQTIFSKRNPIDLNDGYDLSVVNNTIAFNWNNANSIVSDFPFASDRWHHVALTFDGTSYRLYVDGVSVHSPVLGSSPIANSSSKSILGAMIQSTIFPYLPTKFFTGSLQEFRIWNVALSELQIHQMMNQKINNANSTAVFGSAVPLTVPGLNWENLIAYYQMDQSSDIINGFLMDKTNNQLNGKLIGISQSQAETAPLPYTSLSNGAWGAAGTWTNGDVCNIPNTLSIDGTTSIDWNIIRIANDIYSGTNDVTLLGLISDSGKLTMNGLTNAATGTGTGQGLWITHYLKLDGVIDLEGESQLVQRKSTTNQLSESVFEPTSTGYIERDQQGKQNSYNYNYWSSPVSILGVPSNNSPYTVSGILKDGTDAASPKDINFVNGAYSADTPNGSNPIKISGRWIWTYSAVTTGTALENYYKWENVGYWGDINVGDGFSMKGTGGTPTLNNALQNYVFVGKPNSGEIKTSYLNENQTYLIGNPYPSALDADEFIRNNLNSSSCTGCTGSANVFNGTLYFWDHFGLSNSHLLTEYEGGYATYTLMGGVLAKSNIPLTAQTLQTGSKTPERYIPVGQGFFVQATLDPAILGSSTATIDGGYLYFKNGQRLFKKESVTGANSGSLFMKSVKSKTAEANTDKDNRSKIRLGFDSTIGSHRQLLVGSDSNASNGFDIGYDAPMLDMSENDMYLDINNSKFVIEAVPSFNSDQVIPLGINVANEGSLTIKIDALENIPLSTEIYLYDAITEVSHDLRASNFKVFVGTGEYKKRFFLQFAERKLGLKEETKIESGVTIFYSDDNKVIVVTNNDKNVLVTEVSLFNIVGQTISNWEIKDNNHNQITLSVKNMSKGVYIVKTKTTKGESSTKIIVK
jgi:uncharacterized repeat protein (TIGR01451 family)